MAVTPSIPTSDLVKVISEHPGLSSYEIAEHLQVDLSDCTRRVHAMCNSRIPLIKKVKLDGLYRFFPFNFKVEPSPLEGKTTKALNIEGEVVRIGKLTAEELGVFIRTQQESKYAELLAELEKLEVDESIVIESNKYNRLRDAVRRYFKDKKTFTFKNQSYYVILTRTE